MSAKENDLLRIQEIYDVVTLEMGGLRNRLAHAYGTVDAGIVWDVLQVEFPKLREGCERYCEEKGISLTTTWERAASL